MTKHGKPSLVVVDFETTGLNPATGVPLELGMLIVDSDLRVIAEKEAIIEPAAMPLWNELDPFVRSMHTKNGLIEDISRGAGWVKAVVDADFREWLAANHAEKLPMCGSTVSFDRSWMQVHMAELAAVFHYRNVDVSTIKELCRRWNPRIFDHAPPKIEKHRALPDCHETLDELRYYRDEFFFVAVGEHAD